MNWIFLGLIAVSVLVAAFTGNMGFVVKESIESSKTAVKLSLELVGQMTLWLGLMGVVREAGLMRSLANALRPIMVRLFPQVPAEHPAMGAMIMNITANMLGLGNAATPFGLKAMAELDKLNERRGVATNAMALFLVINTSGLAVLPLGVVAIRATLQSKDPGGIIIPSLVGTFVSTVAAVLICLVFQRLPAFRPERFPPAEPTGTKAEPGSTADAALAEAEKVAAPVRSASGARLAIALLLVGLVGIAAFRYGTKSCDPHAAPGPDGAGWLARVFSTHASCSPQQTCRAGTCLAAGDPCLAIDACPAGQVCRDGACAAVACSPSRRCRGAENCRDSATGFVCHEPEDSGGAVLRELFSTWLLPVLILVILAFGMSRRVKVYEAFIPAAKEGFQIGVTIIPYLVAILVSVGMFRASGAMDALVGVLGPITQAVGMPAEALPMALVRPLSGSGALGVLMDTLRVPTTGPDTFVGYLVSLINGSSETTFYVLALYFGSVQVRSVRHTLAACLSSDLVGLAITVAICHVFFG